MRHRSHLVWLAALALLASLEPVDAMPDIELKINSATVIRGADPAPVVPIQNRFGPGLDGMVLSGTLVFRS